MTSVFINEFHYDNMSIDTGEFIEIAGLAGTDLGGWSIILYNGSGGSVYNTSSMSVVLGDDTGTGFGFYLLELDGIQNGAPDGIALVGNDGGVVQFLSYEGSFTASEGAAQGLTSTDIGVSQPGGTPVGSSLQLTGTGSHYEDFVWMSFTSDTRGAVNTQQQLIPDSAVVPLPASLPALMVGLVALRAVTRRRTEAD